MRLEICCRLLTFWVASVDVYETFYCWVTKKKSQWLQEWSNWLPNVLFCPFLVEIVVVVNNLMTKRWKAYPQNCVYASI